MESPRSVAVGVVVFRNSAAELEACLRSLALQTRPELLASVALIDNDEGQGRGAIEAAVAASGISSSLVEVLEGSNVGFGAAQNILMRRDLAAGATHHLCMNPDGVLHPMALDRLSAFAADKGDRGIFEASQFPVAHPKAVHQDDSTAWCSGCCLLIPRQVAEFTGGFDEHFWLYCEDVDLSWRVKAAGLHCFVVPGASIAHHVHDRPHDAAELARRISPQLLAAATLALKWGAEDFALEQLGRLRALTGLAPTPEELRIDFHPSPAELRLADPDFTHGLYFAEPTWSDR